MMNVGDFVTVSYNNGNIYSGEVIGLKSMLPGDGHETERVLFTLKVDNQYRSLYVHKCVSLEIAVPA